MTKIIRDVKKSSQESYDLIIVGGGIYGIMLSFEAVRRKLRPLLLEKHDFISGTSLNHLRTVHGGLRYLQTLDLHRFRESVQERKWFLKYFPHLVKIMPCMMPLYGKGLYRNSIFRAGLLLNDVLSWNRNISIENRDCHLPRGKVIDPSKTKAIFPSVDDQGLTGAAVWYDANVEEHQRLMVEILKLAVNSGATALNYVRADGLLKENHSVKGVRAVDEETQLEYEFKAPVVINAAGPWSRELAEALDRDQVGLFKKRLLVWNVLFKKEALSSYALGLTPGKGKGHNYFFHPWKNRLLVGTGETVVEKSKTETMVPAKEMEKFLEDMNAMVPGLKLTGADIQRVYTGILPAEENGTMTKREKIYDHSVNGGPKGLYSISGIKFTTSRLVADKTLNRVFPKAEKLPFIDIIQKVGNPQHSDTCAKEGGDAGAEGLSHDGTASPSYGYDWEPSDEKDLIRLKEIVENESVRHLGDLILRRTSLGDHPERAVKILPTIRKIFNWEDKKWEDEVEKLHLSKVFGGSREPFFKKVPWPSETN